MFRLLFPFLKRPWLGLLPIAGLLGACEDVVNITAPAGAPQLVVDGAVTDQPGPYVVTLRRTVPYFDPQAELPPVPGALLTITDSEGHRDTLREQTPGTYLTRTLQGKIGNRYVLTIRADNAEYRAETEIRRTPPIDSIRAEYRAATVFDEAGYYVLYYGPELPGVGDFYRFRLLRNDQLLNRPADLFVRSDELIDGRYIRALELNNNEVEEITFAPGDTVRVELNALPRDYYYFLNEVRTQLTNTGLFAAPPANVRTNVQPTQPGGQVTGYFAGYPVRQATVVVR